MRRAFQRAASSCAASASSSSGNFARQRILSGVALNSRLGASLTNTMQQGGLSGPSTMGGSNFAGYINAGAVGVHREGVDTSDPKANQVKAEDDAESDDEEERRDPDMDFSDEEDDADMETANLEGARLDLHEPPPFGKVKSVNPNEYVDMELLAHGFNLETTPLCKSMWRQKKELCSVKRFAPALEEHRRRPFYNVAGGADGDDGIAENVALANRTRLESLWGISNSHGMSWDELDSKFMQFAEAGWKREISWNDNYWYWFRKAEQKARRRAAKIPRFDLEGNKIAAGEGYIRRLTWKYWKHWKKVYFRPWKPGQLTRLLKDFSMKRTMRRETNERKLNLENAAA